MKQYVFKTAKACKINPEVVNSSYSHTELKQLSYCWLYEYFRSKLFGRGRLYEGRIALSTG
jgi:hypothetical protein